MTQKTKPSQSLHLLLYKMGIKVASPRKVVRISCTCLSSFVTRYKFHGPQPPVPQLPTHWLRLPATHQPAQKHLQLKKNKPQRPFPTKAHVLYSSSFITCLPPA